MKLVLILVIIQNNEGTENTKLLIDNDEYLSIFMRVE